MADKGKALVFQRSIPVGGDLVRSAVQALGLELCLPNDLSPSDDSVRVIIIDRPVPATVRICGNLRSQEAYSEITILALLDYEDPEAISQLSALNIDFSVKPVSEQALLRYLSRRISHSSAATTTRLAHPREEETVREVRTSIAEASGAAAAAQLAVTPPEPQLADEIPDCGRLLPRVTGPLSLVKGGIRCASCQKWQVRREDVFCSRCGSALIQLSLPETKVALEPFGSHRTGYNFELKNEGQNPVWLAFTVKGGKELERRFSLHTKLAAIDGESSGFLQLVFDARGLDLTSQYEALLEITANDSRQQKWTVPLVVERLAIPRVTLPKSFTYVLGADNSWEFTVSNDGGGTLTVTSIAAEAAELELSMPLIVKGGQSATARVRVPEMDWAAGHREAELAVRFKRLEQRKLRAAVDVRRPARLNTQPAELQFGVVSTKRERRMPLTLINGGGEELVIESFDPQAPWLECLAETPLRIAPGGSSIAEVRVRSHEGLARYLTANLIIRSNSFGTVATPVPCVVSFVEPEDYQEYIGIDFGTTGSCVAVLDKESRPKVLGLDARVPGGPPRERIMPSVLYFHPDGEVTAGREAQEQALIQPANAVTCIKRVLGSSQQHKLAGREYGATDLTAKIIGELVRRTEDGLFQLGEYKSPRRAIVTVPIDFYDNQRRALVEACKLTGLEMSSQSKHGVVIDEAQAAALYYLHRTGGARSQGGPELLLIFDFGGGTLDCALIEIEIDTERGKARFKTLANQGDQRLGGEDIDWEIARALASRAKSEFDAFDDSCVAENDRVALQYHRHEIADAALLTRARFKQQAEAAKIALSEAPSAGIAISPLLSVDASPRQPYLVNGSGRAAYETTFSRSDLIEILEPFLARASRVIETLCHRAGREPREVTTILHVGRTSALPIVSERINALLPEAEDRSHLIEPKLCVALGAAFWGYVKDLPNADFEFEGVANRTPHDIGYLDMQGMTEVFRTVFPAHTEFPCEKLIELKSGGDWIELRLAENRGTDAHVAGNPEIVPIGRARIGAREIKQQRLPARFAIDENRVVEITANGRTQRIEYAEE